MKEYAIELEGASYLCRKRQREEGSEPAGEEYSFDGGKVWHLKILDAYEMAKKHGRLVPSDTEQGGGDALAVFVVSLMNELKGLKPGESLKIARDRDTVVVVREQTVLATRFSDIGDVDLNLTEALDGDHVQG